MMIKTVLNDKFVHNVHAYMELKDVDVVPNLFSAWTCKGYGYMVIDLLKSCGDMTRNRQYEKLKFSLNKIKEKGWLVVIITSNKFFCNSNGNIMILNFNYAVKQGNEGIDTTYPNHPISIYYDHVFTWNDFDGMQTNFLESNFKSNGKEENLNLGRQNGQLAEYNNNDRQNGQLVEYNNNDRQNRKFLELEYYDENPYSYNNLEELGIIR